MLRTVLHFLVLLPALWMFSPAARGQADLSLHLGAGEPGSESFELGVGITSLIKVRLLPSKGIDLTLVETAGENVPGDLLITEQSALAALSGEEPITRRSKDQLRSIMAFRRSDFGAGPPLELVARADIADEAIYLITKSILENGIFLEDINQRDWDLSADQALIDLNLPLHPGAVQYYEEIGEANLSTAIAGSPEQAADGLESSSDGNGTVYSDSTFFLNFSTDATTLDPRGQRQIAEACQYAAIFDAPRIHVAGRASDPPDRDDLQRERVRLVVEALRANERCAGNVEIVSADRTLSSAPGGPGHQVEVVIMLP
jgi:hypothetical protein